MAIKGGYQMSVPAAYLGVILIWSTTPLAIQWSGEEGHYLFGVAARMVIGLVVSLVVLAMLRRALPTDRKALWSYVVAGLGIFAAMSSTYWGAQYISSGLISVIFGLTPFATGVMAALWLGEPSLTRTRLWG
jgi:drug/metabolite transporter (DMT)-like permease